MSALSFILNVFQSSDVHITRSTLARRFCGTRLASILVYLIRIAEVGLAAAEALRAKVDTAVRIASLATPASTVRRCHGNGAELSGLEDADAAIIVATQRRERCVVGC
jgi:hypothetical protein